MEFRELNSLLLTNPVLIGILAGAIGAILSAYVSNAFQERREKKQWVRDKLQEIYTNCIFNLSVAERIYSTSPNERRNALLESSKWLSLLLIYHPFRNSKGYEELVNKVESILEFWEALDQLKETIEEIYKLTSRGESLELEQEEEFDSKQEELPRLASELKRQIINLAAKNPRLG